jgi:hypothetical protein
MRLYLVRALAPHPTGYTPSTFLGIYRDHTPEAAILTAREDHQKTFASQPVLCLDLSARVRLVSLEVSCAIFVVLFPDGEMGRGELHPGSRSILAAQRGFYAHLRTA